MGESDSPPLHDGAIQQFYVLFGLACFVFLVVAIAAFAWKLWRRGKV